MAPACGLIHDERFCDHDTGTGHPERPDRMRAIQQRLRSSGLHDRCQPIEFSAAGLDSVHLVHEPVYVQRLRTACAGGAGFIDVADSAICAASFDVALLAVGAAVAAVEAVLAKGVRHAFCAVRPPGHHAEADQSMGFCLFNNVAIAAEHLRKRGLERIAIVDFDVHHGNGTQHSFEQRKDVLYISLHEDPRYLYPGTGFAHERGVGHGAGHTINVPMKPHSGDQQYEAAMTEVVVPALQAFEPQMLLVSAGFDAVAADPLGHMKLSAAYFATMTRQLCQVAEEHCNGRLVCLLEGGYDLTALADSVEAVVSALLDSGSGAS